MVTSNGSFGEQVRKYLADIRSELNKLEAQKKDLDTKIADLNMVAQGLEIALDWDTKATGREHILKIDWVSFLRGKTRKEQIRIIAKERGGRVKVSDATDILFTNGLTKSKKRQGAYAIIYGRIMEMIDNGTLEKVGPGEFQIPRFQQSLPGIKQDQEY